MLPPDFGEDLIPTRKSVQTVLARAAGLWRLWSSKSTLGSKSWGEVTLRWLGLSQDPAEHAQNMREEVCPWAEGDYLSPHCPDDFQNLTKPFLGSSAEAFGQAAAPLEGMGTTQT